MKYVALPFQEPRRLSFYLAMEEFVARHTDEPDAFFMWQVEPSVIFGRNQVLENEVNVAYCREHGISLYRRKSRFVNMVLLVLRKLGIAATGTSHNDIMIGDRKVCGTACYHLEGRSIVHSTMLFDTNMDHMLNAITPSREKLEKKGIESVRQRITLLKDYTMLDSVEALKALIRETLCEGERMLTASEVAGIEAIEATYLKEEFINLL